MYREGHIGAALLAYAPVGTALAVMASRELALVGAAVMVVVSTLPDWDNRVPLLSHRGVTHTVLFAFVVGGVLAWGATIVGDQLAVGDRSMLAAYGFFLGSLAILVHVGVDALTPAGVRPFWPLWDRTFSLGVVRAGNPVGNYTLLTLGVLASGVSLLVVAG